MSIHRTAAKRDANEPPIITALKRAGCSVTQLSGPGVPDLLVGFQGRTELMEVKGDGCKLTEAQEDWHGCWQGPKVPIVHNEQEALAVLLRGRP